LANPSSASSSRGGTNREEVLIGHCKRAEWMPVINVDRLERSVKSNPRIRR
jgi:hypothetical protein